MLLEPEESERIIRARLRSRDWWTFVYEGRSGSRVAQAIEEAFYSGKASADFELFAFVVPDRPGAAVAMGKKARVAAGPLWELLKEQSQFVLAPGGGRPDLAAQDVIFLAEEPAGLAAWLLSVFERGPGEDEGG